MNCATLRTMIYSAKPFDCRTARTITTIIHRLTTIGGGRGQWLGGHHGECGARAYNGSLGQSPQRGPGAEPLVRGTKPPEAESILVIGCPTEPANLAPVRENSMRCYGPLVSELGAQSAWCPLNPVIRGACAPPPAPPPMIVRLSYITDAQTVHLLTTSDINCC